jgi:hypothetical protein
MHLVSEHYKKYFIHRKYNNTIININIAHAYIHAPMTSSKLLFRY